MSSLSNEDKGFRQRIRGLLLRDRSRSPNNEQSQEDPPHRIHSSSSPQRPSINANYSDSTGARRRPFNRFRNELREFLHDTQAKQVLAMSNASASHFGTASSQTLIHVNAGDNQSTNTGQKGTASTPCLTGPKQDVTDDQLSLHESISSLDASLDIWSAAYREAVEGLGKEIASALSGKSAKQLFRELEEFEREATHESAFLRGVERLRSLKTPLDTFKLALDLASPLASLEPTASAVLGVVRSVTASAFHITKLAITFANADIDFAKQIADMLGRISYIDDCDALGQKAGRRDIHNALVSVYQKLLEFYSAALEILGRKGVKLAMKLVSENERLPNIVKEFLLCADNLHFEIQKATMDILVDIKNMLYAQDISRWLKLDKFGHQSQMLGEWQRDRENKACEFLLENAKFNTWYTTPESRQLAILGAKGHGKTLIMTFLAEELERRNRYQLPRPVLCQYYCRDDETGKATTVLCALIYSLLNHKQLEGLQKTFHERYKEALSSDYDPASNIVTLEKLLGSMLRTIDRPIFFVIDGIDECDDDSQSSLLDFLSSILQTAPALKIILSARPRQEILDRLDNATTIELAPNPKRDLLIVKKTLEKLPRRLSPDAKAQIQKTLSERMQGSGIWTKMIIELIKARRLMTKVTIDQFLEAIPLPHELSKVYSSLLLRCTSDDDENLQIAETALRVLAVSHRPLSILELAWAVATSLARNVKTVRALAQVVDHQRVMELIHPFIASPDYDELRKPQVRLTHQSVREWVRELPRGNGLESKESDETGHDGELLSDFMLNICIKYLLLDEIDNIDLFSEEQAAFEQLPQLSGSFLDYQKSTNYDRNCTWETWEDDMARYDPIDRGLGELFVYASVHWTDHFGGTGSTVEHIPNLWSIENLCQPGSTRLRNWTQQNCRPGCTMLPRFEFDSTLYDPLGITSLFGSEAVLRSMVRVSSFDNGKYFEDTAMRAADQILQWGDLSRLKILLLDNRTGRHLKNFDLFRLIVKRWDRARLIINPRKERQNWDLVFDLIGHVTENMIEDHWGNKLFCFAAGAGCMPIVQRLMISAQHSRELRDELLGTDVKRKRSSFEEETHQSIGHAVLGNHTDIVGYLGEFGFEAHFRYRNSRGENVLHLASELCNPDMFRLLLQRFPEGIYAEDYKGETPLLRVIMSPSAKRYQCAMRILLSSTNRISARCLDWQGQALRTAVSRRDLEMCSILICLGNIDPLAALIDDGKGQKSSKETGLEYEDDMLPILFNLFSSEGNPADIDIRRLAEKHYIKCFNGYTE